LTRVEYHPIFAAQYEALCRNPALAELAGEVTQLIDALERHGHELEGDGADDPSRPIISSALRMFALRRTPPTTFTPYADHPPVVRMPYVWFVDDATGEEFAVVMLIGDKTQLGNQWYPAKVRQIESQLVPEWERIHATHRAVRGRRPA
jgi:hypothetical protein